MVPRAEPGLMDGIYRKKDAKSEPLKNWKDCLM